MSEQSEYEVLRQSIQGKIQALINEFSRGDISREQFNVIYGRYQSQLNAAMGAQADSDSEVAYSEVSTDMIRAATAGKAIGLSIYHHASGTTLETLGTYDVPAEMVSAALNEISDKLEARVFVGKRIEQIAEGSWLVLTTRSFTTAIVVFHNQPAQRQIEHIEHLLHDFEEANRIHLETANIDAQKLAQPFVTFVRKK